MKSELIVDVSPGEVSIALLEDGRLVQLQKEARNISYAVGDIYLAKVKKLMPGLNAAFVNVGYEKDAFLHYLDLGSRFASFSEFTNRLLDDKKSVPSISKQKLLPDIDKHGSVADLLEPGRELPVQIVKEPISSKGPRLTTEITFTGRYLVLIPFSDKISISQKIKSTEEKLRLRKLIESIKPKNFGVIVRTSAEDKRVAELNHELKTLVGYWEEAMAKAQRVQSPSLIFEEESRIVGMLRDVFSPSFENIYVNDQATYEQIRNYVQLIAPDRVDIVKQYTKVEPIFDHFSITRQIKSSFGKTVSFKSGAYIIIEHTEALHVIDVNSGNRTKAGNDQETNALEVNLRAADEIARQLRLRDMGGIIVIDFIDMGKNEHRQQLYDHMREIMANDRARHNILPLSKFGLMQITRQRVRPALDITTSETCPSCFGKGEVQPSLLFTDTLYEKLDYVINTLGQKGFVMYIHPYVEAYIKKGLIFSMYRKWRSKLGRCFKIVADQSLAYLEYRVVGADGQLIDLREEKDTDSSSSTKAKQKTKNRLEDSLNADDSDGNGKRKQKADKPPKQKQLTDGSEKQPKQKQPKQKQQADKQTEATDKQPKQKQQADKQTDAADKQPKQKQQADSVATASRRGASGDAAEPDQQPQLERPEGQKLSRNARRRQRQAAAKAAARAAAADAEFVEVEQPTDTAQPGSGTLRVPCEGQAILAADHQLPSADARHAERDATRPCDVQPAAERDATRPCDTVLDAQPVPATDVQTDAPVSQQLTMPLDDDSEATADAAPKKKPRRGRRSSGGRSRAAEQHDRQEHDADQAPPQVPHEATPHREEPTS